MARQEHGHQTRMLRWSEDCVKRDAAPSALESKTNGRETAGDSFRPEGSSGDTKTADGRTSHGARSGIPSKETTRNNDRGIAAAKYLGL
ncbi:hypothetical protein FOPE_08407 [Fonsecaea pedrosoi]|nr:hypothetical protein FOPE_08407 [Fonsecaea pedrosoi]